MRFCSTSDIFNHLSPLTSDPLEPQQYRFPLFFFKKKTIFGERPFDHRQKDAKRANRRKIYENLEELAN